MIKFQTVIFDLFGTLTISVGQHFSDKQLADMANVLEMDIVDFTDIWESTFEERVTGQFETLEANIVFIANKLNHTISDLALSQAMQIRNTATRYLLNQLRKDALDTLSRLKLIGLKTGLISDTTPEVPAIWRETMLPEYFDAVIFSDIIKIKKPNPKIYLQMCDMLNCLPSQCIYIGDGGSNELSGAESVGMFPIRICPTANEDLFQPSRDNWNKLRIEKLSDLFYYI